MNSDRNWVLEVDPRIYKFLSKIPRGDAERILFAITKLQDNPYTGDIEKMKGERNSWRRRIGSYRIFYEIIVSERTINVFHIERRGSKTY